MKTGMPANLLKAIALLSWVFFSACGTSTNPTETYQDVQGRAVAPKDLRPRVAPTPWPSPTPWPESPTTKLPDEFRQAGSLEGVFPPPATDELVFTAGEEKTVQLDLPVRLPGMIYEIRALGLPEGAVFTHLQDSKYELKWLPKSSKEIKVTLILSAWKFDNDDIVDAFQRAVKERELTLRVTAGGAK